MRDADTDTTPVPLFAEDHGAGYMPGDDPVPPTTTAAQEAWDTPLDIMRRELPIGSRVELHPRLDDWVRGDRFGVVVGHGAHTARVRLDRSGRERRYAPDDLTVTARGEG